MRFDSACDLGCLLCQGTGPAPTADPRGIARRGGGRLTVRGGADEIGEALRAAGAWREVRVHTHAAARRGSRSSAALSSWLDASVAAVLVPLFSHVDVVHDRVVGRPGSLAETLTSLAALGEAGLRVDVEIPLLPRRLAHPLSILRRARAMTDALRSVRFVVARGRLPTALAPPRWSEAAPLLEEAFDWCADHAVEASLRRDDAIPLCALTGSSRSVGVHRFDPRRAREPARGCVRAGPCTTCACAPQCSGVADTYARAHGFSDITPFDATPAALYEQRTTPRREWTDDQRSAARSAGLLVLRPTVNCNQDCTFCSANETSQNVWTAPSSMYEQIARAGRRGVERLAFGGGEPTLARELEDYVAAARRVGVEEVELVTNGTLLDGAARVAALAAAGLTHAFVSLHAHDEALSRHLTQKVGDFERTVTAIDLLAGAGVKTAINHVITAKNFRYLPAFVRFVWRRFGGAVAISFAFVTPQYKALENFELVPRMADVRPFLHAALAEAMSLGQPFWVGARQGLPPCQLGAFRAWSDIFEHADAGLSEDTPQKVRGPQCERCAYADVCTGVWRPYADRFGLDELEPIELPRFGGRERVTVEDLKTERWGTPPPSLEALPDFLRDRAAEARLSRSTDEPLEPSIEQAFLPARARPLRVALLGSATRARQLAAAIRSCRDLTLDAVVSPHVEDSAADEFGGCPRWSDVAAVLDRTRPDALVIAAAPAAQAALATRGLERGLPVLLARPIPAELLAQGPSGLGTLVPAYGLLFAKILDAPTQLVYRVGSAAPLTWSRRTLRPHVEDLLALAVRQDPSVVFVAVRVAGAPRPEAVEVRLEGVRSLRLELDLRVGEPRLVSRRDDTSLRASTDVTEAMVRQFASVAARTTSPMLSARDVTRVGALVREVLGAIDAGGRFAPRSDEPRHVASPGFRGGDS